MWGVMKFVEYVIQTKCNLKENCHAVKCYALVLNMKGKADGFRVFRNEKISNPSGIKARFIYNLPKV